jgi:hypothetical protein
VEKKEYGDNRSEPANNTGGQTHAADDDGPHDEEFYLTAVDVDYPHACQR